MEKAIMDADPEDIGGTLIPAAELTLRLKAVAAARLLVLMDACHSGGAARLREKSSQNASVMSSSSRTLPFPAAPGTIAPNRKP